MWKRISLALALVALLTAGCAGPAPTAPASPAAPDSPTASAPAPAAQAARAERERLNQQVADLSVQLRWKAGVYHDQKQGRILITLYEPHFRSEAERAVAEIIGLPAPHVVIQESKYDGAQLGEWYTRLGQHTGEVNGITTSSVDRSVNRIHYAVTTVEAKERLEAAIRKAGVPLDAVIIDLPEGALSEANPLKGCQLGKLPPLPQEKPSAYSLQIGGTPLRPGREFTLKVAGARGNELTRGIDAYLDCWDGKDWSPRYTLFSPLGDREPVAAIYSQHQVILSIGFDASSPGRFVLPSALTPGWYRIRLEVSGTVNGAYAPYRLWTPVEVKP